MSPQRWEEAGTVLVHDLDHERRAPEHRWQLVVQVGDVTVDLPDEDTGYTTRGAAVDAAEQWAAQRGVLLVLGLLGLRKPATEGAS